jgi:membrane protease YdiL (CAAX protease family)
MGRATLIRLEVITSATLIALAALWSWVSGVGLAAQVRVSVPALAAGVGGGLLIAATIPLFTAPWAAQVTLLRDMKRVWDTLLVSLAHDLRFADIVLLAALSGVSEELLFRGALQPSVGLAAASLLFGALHLVNPAYALWATGVGALFGVTYASTANLVVPMAMHATYNFLALLYLRYRHIERLREGARLPRV